MSDKTELREQAFALYKPPFKFRDGYIYDSADQMVSDGPDETGIQRVRGWGRIGYMPKGEQLQDTVGELIAEALTEAWNRRATIQPTARMVEQGVAALLQCTITELGDYSEKLMTGYEADVRRVFAAMSAAPVAPADAVRDARDLALTQSHQEKKL